jgi:type II secretory ATPase GspE/PulE/Tfp pilus assembly ATPase PilB-like protein
MITLLAETPAPTFLMSVAKPLVSLALFVPYGAIVSGTLVKDAQYYNHNPSKWASIFLGFATVALLAVLLTPWWAAGVAVQIILLAVPCIWYVKFRNANTPTGKKLNLFNLDFEKMASDRRAKSARSSVTLRFQRRDRTEFTVPEQKDPAHVSYVALQDMLLPVLGTRISRLDIALSKQGAAVSTMTDGIRTKRDGLPPEQATAVVDLLKTFAGLEPGERRKYQRGLASAIRNDSKTVLTVSTMGSMQGETVRVDVERDKQLTIPLDKAGLLEGQLKLLKETLAADPQGGVVLAGARPGNGLTTLGYTLLSNHDAFISNIKTIERRPERQVDGVEHSTFDAARADFSTQLQTIIRRGPDVVLVSEAGEPGVGKVVSAPASRNQLFYLLMPSDNALEMLTAWSKSAGDARNASEALKLLVAARLLRRLCPACRVAYQPGPDMMKMLAIPAGKAVQLYRHSGKVLVKDQPTDCPTCSGAGFLGLTAAFEVLAFDDEARNLIKSGDIKGAYMQARRAHRSLTLQEAALMKVRSGETSLEEVKRVFAAAPAGGAPASPAGGGAPAAPAAPASSPRPPAAPANRPAGG